MHKKPNKTIIYFSRFFFFFFFFYSPFSRGSLGSLC